MSGRNCENPKNWPEIEDREASERNEDHPEESDQDERETPQDLPAFYLKELEREKFKQMTRLTVETLSPSILHPLKY